MRWLISLFLVLGLGLMGCSATNGTDGNGGDAGHGGVGGNGGLGGDAVIECGPTDGVRCLYEFEELNEEIPGRCYNGVCRANECADLWTGALCVLVGVEDFEGFCEDGECKDAITDCTDAGYLQPCAGETTSFCYEDACYPYDCTGLEDGTECIAVGPMGNPGIITCENGECQGSAP